MSNQFISEIRLVSFEFPPKGWAFCDGQILSIQQNTALFSLIGTFYGGNGTTNFALPNLQGRVPIHMGPEFPLGEPGGEETHTLDQAEMPAHNHLYGSLNQATSMAPGGNAFAAKPRFGVSRYAPPGSPLMINDGTAATGGSQPHSNLQPYLTLNFIIALQGIFPSRN